MPAWALRGGDSATDGDWFAQRFARARTLLPLALFDTIIPVEFAETITTELVDVVGVADASPANDQPAGVVEVLVGDPAITPSQARLQLTGSGSHVRSLVGYWYAAGLVKYAGPLEVADLGDTGADMIALWFDDDNRVTLGVLGNASGGSTSNWVGRANNAASNTTTLGPALDPPEGPVWHLFEMWLNEAAATLHFAIDGVEFGDTIALVDVPAQPAKLGPIVQRTAVGEVAEVLWDKLTVVVRSPTVGEP
jgi:hypothetical protein